MLSGNIFLFFSRLLTLTDLAARLPNFVGDLAQNVAGGAIAQPQTYPISGLPGYFTAVAQMTPFQAPALPGNPAVVEGNFKYSNLVSRFSNFICTDASIATVLPNDTVIGKLMS